MPKSFYLLTAFGKDRPGIVAQVTRAVFQAGGNVEDASMTRLGGEFTMMLVVAHTNAKAGNQFLNTLSALQKKTGLVLNAKTIPRAQAYIRPTQATHLISMYGTDRPGIVYKAAQELADRRINITDLNTKTLQRAGKTLYIMLLEVQLSSPAKAAALKKTLERLGRTLRLDVSLQDIDPVSL